MEVPKSTVVSLGNHDSDDVPVLFSRALPLVERHFTQGARNTYFKENFLVTSLRFAQLLDHYSRTGSYFTAFHNWSFPTMTDEQIEAEKRKFVAGSDLNDNFLYLKAEYLMLDLITASLQSRGAQFILGSEQYDEGTNDTFRQMAAVLNSLERKSQQFFQLGDPDAVSENIMEAHQNMAKIIKKRHLLLPETLANAADSDVSGPDRMFIRYGTGHRFFFEQLAQSGSLGEAVVVYDPGYERPTFMEMVIRELELRPEAEIPYDVRMKIAMERMANIWSRMTGMPRELKVTLVHNLPNFASTSEIESIISSVPKGTFHSQMTALAAS